MPAWIRDTNKCILKSVGFSLRLHQVVGSQFGMGCILASAGDCWGQHQHQHHPSDSTSASMDMNHQHWLSPALAPARVLNCLGWRIGLAGTLRRRKTANPIPSRRQRAEVQSRGLMNKSCKKQVV
jgi:hypothetical protein